MATSNFHSQFLALALLLIHVVNSTIQATNHGFEIDLTHRDSPNSPLYNPNRIPLEPLQRLFSSCLLSSESFKCDFIQSKCCLFKCISQQCKSVTTLTDSSLAKGVLSTETITFGSSSGNSISFNNIVFGCGHNNTEIFNENEMGLIGLGGRNSSLVSQVCSKFGTNFFSHCLVPFHTDPSLTSKMYFGSNSKVSGPGVDSTHLVPKDGKIMFYFVTLEGISVGDKFIPYNSSQPISKGNMLIDSGTPPTLLCKDFYKRLADEVSGAIKLKPYQDPQFGTQLCYKSQSVIDIDAPILTAHFDGGGKVPLIQTSTFVPTLEGVFCFAMQPIDDGDDVGIWGSKNK
ncbi:hypothetical protein Dsin_001468 [Dipteronia sinensis]|uniref:Peptidase A1 domain-containing protein n=1 Tax=Dipteronia sinensis TaxID=43782 RepID=A0AAE0B574_9ROSI|nr:hypothetical protein Dsin_001468 [Dipteronia sinensis]